MLYPLSYEGASIAWAGYRVGGLPCSRTGTTPRPGWVSVVPGRGLPGRSWSWPGVRQALDLRHDLWQGVDLLCFDT